MVKIRRMTGNATPADYVRAEEAATQAIRDGLDDDALQAFVQAAIPDLAVFASFDGNEAIVVLDDKRIRRST